MNRRSFLKTTFAATSALGFSLPQLRADQPPSGEKLVFASPLTHSDWMLRPNIAWGPEGVRHMLEACKSAGWSRVFWRVFDAGRANYKSKLLPIGLHGEEDNFWNPQTDADKALNKRFFPNFSEEKRREILAKMAAIDYTTFDSLAEAVRCGHQLGLQIHAWATINEDDHGWGWPSAFTKKHPEFRWHKRDGTRYRSQLSFAFSQVRKYKLALLKELLQYDLDGLFLDWIRTGDVRDNPQNDADGVADYGYEKPNLVKCQSLLQLDAHALPNGDERWVRLRAESQTVFMRELRKLVRSKKKNLPIAAMVGHPWHYRGELNKIDGNLRGLLLDVTAWAREGLVDSVVAAGYYRDGGDAEKAWRALQQETEGKVDVWTYAWVPRTLPDFERDFALAQRVGAKQILFWEADYVEDVPAEVRTAMLKRAWISPAQRQTPAGAQK